MKPGQKKYVIIYIAKIPKNKEAHKLIPISAPANFSLSLRSPHDEQPREVNRTAKSPSRRRIVRDEKIKAPKGGGGFYV